MNQDQPSPGKRLKPGMPTAAKAAIIIVLVAAALFAGYAAFCAWVGERIPDGTMVELQPSGQVVSLSGLSAEEAASVLAQSIQVDESYHLTVSCGGRSFTVESSVLSPDSEAMLHTLAQAIELMDSRSFLARGVAYLAEKAGVAPTHYFELPCTYRYGEEGEAEVERLLAETGRAAAVAPVDPVYTVGEDSVEVTLGSPGAALDEEKAKNAILTALLQKQTALTISMDTVAPASLDAEALNEEVYVAPVPVSVDGSGKATPPVVGVSIDVDAAREALNTAAPGETVTIPLVYTQPDYAQASQEGLLYQDLLSECVTSIGGSEGRLGNVTLAAGKCNGTILFPGDVFDYNKVVGQRTAAGGYKPAPAYIGGETVETIGGGICQVSSSIYYCTVYANLEVVSRINHRYVPSYLPNGLDATVSWGGPEYRFRNNTDFPVKIVAFVSGRTLTVQFYGTNPDGIYVTTERSQVSSSSYTTVYKPDPSIPVGTTKVSVTPYSGCKVVVYRCVHAADGTLISRVLENTSDYKSRDKVILYNPADAASLGLPGGEETPPETTAPEESDPPVESEQPTESDPPVIPDPPAESDPPLIPDPPAESDPPVQPDPPVESDPPVQSDPPAADPGPQPEESIPID